MMSLKPYQELWLLGSTRRTNYMFDVTGRDMMLPLGEQRHFTFSPMTSGKPYGGGGRLHNICVKNSVSRG